LNSLKEIPSLSDTFADFPPNGTSPRPKINGDGIAANITGSRRYRRMAHEPTREIDRPMTAPQERIPSRPANSPSEPVTRLRGAGVNYDARRVGHVAVGLCLVALATLVIIFTIAGFHRNNQISELHHDGVPVTVTVTNCLGLMGGSGSNAAGYSCTGAFTIHGTRYTESLPGTGFHNIGSTVPATAVPNDPALVSPDKILRSEHTSFSVFILPLVLLAVLALLVALIVRVRRRRARPARQPQTAT